MAAPSGPPFLLNVALTPKSASYVKRNGQKTDSVKLVAQHTTSAALEQAFLGRTGHGLTSTFKFIKTGITSTAEQLPGMLDFDAAGRLAVFGSPDGGAVSTSLTFGNIKGATLLERQAKQKKAITIKNESSDGEYSFMFSKSIFSSPYDRPILLDLSTGASGPSSAPSSSKDTGFQDQIGTTTYRLIKKCIMM